jgi:hypothetical protein
MNRTIASALAGVAGASALTAVHQAARGVTAYAPRMDVLGARAVRATHEKLGLSHRSDRVVERQALAGDLVANAAYYALVGAGGRGSLWLRGIGLGLVAGLGAIMLPGRIGLGDPPHAGRLDTQAMTVAWYVLGGLTAAAMFALRRDEAVARPIA